jgi:hypothetical protein
MVSPPTYLKFELTFCDFDANGGEIVHKDGDRGSKQMK